MELKLEKEIIGQVQNYLIDRNNKERFETYEELIRKYPIVNKIVESYFRREVKDEKEYEKRFEALCDELPNKVIVDTKYLLGNSFKEISKKQEKQKRKEEVQEKLIPPIHHPHFKDINDKINRLIDLNRKINGDEFVDENIIKQRDLIIEEIIFHDTFAKVIDYKAKKTAKHYDMFDTEALQIIYNDIVTKMLQKPAFDYTLYNPEARIYSYLFKKSPYADLKTGNIDYMDYVDLAFNDFKEKKKDGKSYINKEELGRYKENKSGNYENTFEEGLNAKAYKEYILAEIKDTIEQNNIPEVIESKYKISYIYKTYEIMDVRNSLWRDPKQVPLWVIYIRGLVYGFLKPKQRDVIEYYYYKNFSFKEIGKILKIDITNVRRNHNHAIKIMRAKIFESDFYRQFPDLRRVFGCSIDDFVCGLKIIYQKEPESPLMIRLMKIKLTELQNNLKDVS